MVNCLLIAFDESLPSEIELFFINMPIVPNKGEVLDIDEMTPEGISLGHLYIKDVVSFNMMVRFWKWSKRGDCVIAKVYLETI